MPSPLWAEHPFDYAQGKAATPGRGKPRPYKSKERGRAKKAAAAQKKDGDIKSPLQTRDGLKAAATLKKDGDIKSPLQ